MGEQHVDRDAQFGYINDKARAFMEEGQPVISVDAKKKELVGNFANKGGEYLPSGQPALVLDHDSVLELHKDYAGNALVGLGRLYG